MQPAISRDPRRSALSHAAPGPLLRRLHRQQTRRERRETSQPQLQQGEAAYRTHSFRHHHIGRLDDGNGFVADFEAKFVDGLVGDGRGDHDAMTGIDPHMGRRLALLYGDDLALELIARAELHPSSPFSMAAMTIERVARAERLTHGSDSCEGTGMTVGTLNESDRRTALEETERKALSLFDAIEEAGFVRAGRTEREVERDIFELALSRFGIEKHWHKRVVRAGANTLTTYHDNPPDRIIEPDDTVYLDLGPVFEDWEADIGRTYALGGAGEKQRLVEDLDRVFARVQKHYRATPE